MIYYRLLRPFLGKDWEYQKVLNAQRFFSSRVPDIELYIYDVEDDGEYQWRICSAVCGATIASGDTEDEAVDVFNAIVDKRGPQAIRERIAQAVKAHGKAPGWPA